eukprot:310522_1
MLLFVVENTGKKKEFEFLSHMFLPKVEYRTVRLPAACNLNENPVVSLFQGVGCCVAGFSQPHLVQRSNRSISRSHSQPRLPRADPRTKAAVRQRRGSAVFMAVPRDKPQPHRKFGELEITERLMKRTAKQVEAITRDLGSHTHYKSKLRYGNLKHPPSDGIAIMSASPISPRIPSTLTQVSREKQFVRME